MSNPFVPPTPPGKPGDNGQPAAPLVPPLPVPPAPVAPAQAGPTPGQASPTPGAWAVNPPMPAGGTASGNGAPMGYAPAATPPAALAASHPAPQLQTGQPSQPMQPMRPMQLMPPGQLPQPGPALPRERKALHPAWWALIGVAVVAVVIGGIWMVTRTSGALTGASGRPSASSAQPLPSMQFDAGVCLLTAPDDASQDVTVDCAQPHAAESIGKVDLDVATYSTGAVNAAARQACNDLSATMVPQAVNAQVAAILYYPPTRTEWQGGTHQASCVVELTIPVTGSIVAGSLTGADGLYAEGDCLTDMPLSPWEGPNPVPCDQQHIAQVTQTFEPADIQDFDAAALDKQARSQCSVFREGLSVDGQLAAWLGDAWLLPDQGAWALGDHTIVCIAQVQNGGVVTGSLLDGSATLVTSEVGTV